MKKAVIKTPFTVTQWFGRDYPYYEEEEDGNTFAVGDEVVVLHEAKPNPMGRLFVIYSEKINNSTVVTESYLEFVDE